MLINVLNKYHFVIKSVSFLKFTGLLLNIFVFKLASKLHNRKSSRLFRSNLVYLHSKGKDIYFSTAWNINSRERTYTFRSSLSCKSVHLLFRRTSGPACHY